MPGKRYVTVLLIIFLLFGGFFSLYYFYYIPANRSRLHQYGFALLDRVKTNIIARDKNLHQLYYNTVSRHLGPNLDSLDKKLSHLTPRPSIFRDTAFLCNNIPAPGITGKLVQDTTAHFAYADGWQLVYPTRAAWKDTLINLAIPVAELAEPGFAYRKEFFESFLLVRACQPGGIVLYGADELGMRQELQGDSLLLLQKGSRAPQVTDISLQGMPYKLFTWSFLLERQQIVLCGLVKQPTYTAAIHTIPLAIVYTVIIVLLLLLLAIPFLKLYFMTRTERLRLMDLSLGALSISVGVAMITLIIIHVLLLLRSGLEITGNLQTLSHQIGDSVATELKLAGRQLDFYDRQLHNQQDSSYKGAGKTLTVNRADPRGSIDIPWGDTYFYFNRIGWVDATGMQQWKIQIDDPQNVRFIDVSGRRYYEAFAQQPPGMPADSSLLAMEPVTSWTSGDFEVNISRRSRIPGHIAVMTTHFSSLLHTILPPGYGYCLMDEAGNVYTHFDMNRNLKENFLDETGRLRAVQEAITSRQDTTLRNVMLYSKPHSVYIRPLQKPSLFLVTFYDESYYLAVYLRILAFSLLFLLVCAVSVILAMLLLYSKPDRSFLLSPADYSQWILPQRSMRAYYRGGSFFMLAYLIVILSLLSLSNEYVLFFLTCLSPLNVMCMMAALRLHYGRQQTDEPVIAASRVRILVGVLAVVTILCGFAARISLSTGLLFYIFQFGLILLLLALLAEKGVGRSISRMVDRIRIMRRVEMDYLSWHAVLMLFLTLCLSALPAALLTWFAHNHEITQSVKKGQLSLAGKLEKRAKYIQAFLQNHDTSVTGGHYADTINFNKGIYSIYGDLVRPVPGDSGYRHGKENPYHTASQNFYLEISNSLIPNYNDPLFYPALRDNASDHHWHWHSSLKDTLEFLYSIRPKGVFGQDTLQASNILVQSRLPQRYTVNNWKGVIVGLLALLLLIGIGYLIRTTIFRFFSFRFVHKLESWEGKPEDTQPITYSDFLDKCFEASKGRLGPGMDVYTGAVDFLEKECRSFADDDRQEKTAAYEMDIIQRTDRVRPLFDKIWETCTEDDKLLLADLAQYGVINYKNTEGIFRLIKNRLVIACEGRLRLMNPNFRYYVLTRLDAPEVLELRKKRQTGGRWQMVRFPLLVIILVVGIFLFVTQEEVFNKAGVILTSVTSVVSLLIKFISDNTGNRK